MNYSTHPSNLIRAELGNMTVLVGWRTQKSRNFCFIIYYLGQNIKKLETYSSRGFLINETVWSASAADPHWCHDSELVPKINYHAMHALNELKKKNNGLWAMWCTVCNHCLFCFIIELNFLFVAATLMLCVNKEKNKRITKETQKGYFKSKMLSWGLFIV